MIHIPSSYIISSRFSTLEPNDILKIIHLAEQKWNEREIQKRLKIPEKPFIGIGITNPQELDTVMNKQNIPIIHIHSDCKSLQANQKHKLKRQYYWHRCLWALESTLWGIIG
ncbi:hypothetical protein BDF20DRAFT_804184, partial [Mycotypha africana]|uniref:uncharacterized protein n=1 Tax=Mycotypha africana TaxID=64632 RepID=UPI00230158D8